MVDVLSYNAHPTMKVGQGSRKVGIPNRVPGEYSRDPWVPGKIDSWAPNGSKVDSFVGSPWASTFYFFFKKISKKGKNVMKDK